MVQKYLGTMHTFPPRVPGTPLTLTLTNGVRDGPKVPGDVAYIPTEISRDVKSGRGTFYHPYKRKTEGRSGTLGDVKRGRNVPEGIFGD